MNEPSSPPVHHLRLPHLSPRKAPMAMPLKSLLFFVALQPCALQRAGGHSTCASLNPSVRGGLNGLGRGGAGRGVLKGRDFFFFFAKDSP